MREKLIELIQNSVGGCARNWAEVIATYLIANGVTILPEGAMILTRAELDALNKYEEKIKAADAVEVVRCKDCKHCTLTEEGEHAHDDVEYYIDQIEKEMVEEKN